MDFRNCNSSMSLSDQDIADRLHRFSDAGSTRSTGLPLPSMRNKRGCDYLKPFARAHVSKKRKKKHICVEFLGYDSKKECDIDYLRVDCKGLSRSLKYMNDKHEMITKKKRILVKYEFEFENGPFIETLVSKSGFTRSSLAEAIAVKYQELFKRPSVIKWVKKLATVGVKNVSKNEDGIYEIDADIN